MTGCLVCGGPVPLDHRYLPARPRPYCGNNCRRKAKYRLPCIRCGGPTMNYSNASPDRICRPCAIADHAAFQGRVEALRAEEWQTMWAAGMTSGEIAQATGWRSAKVVGVGIAQLRAKGYEFPHRRPAHVVEWARALGNSR